ncbi:MAG: tetratricopeptide repeat protein [Polyangiales bacterium]
MAHQLGGEQAAKARWLEARDVYSDHAGEPTKAFESLLRAFSLDLDDGELLDRVDADGVALEAYPRLEQVYETLIRRTEAADEKVQLLQRHATLLETKAARPSEALDRLLRAINLTPGDDALLERAETLAVATGRAADLLPALDRRAGSYSDPAQAVPAVLRAARWAATRVDDADAAMRYVRKATSLAHGDAEALSEIEGLVTGMDESAGGDTLRRALIATYRETAEFAGPKGVPALLRAASLLEALGEGDEARTTVEQAVRNAPLDDDAYARLLALSEAPERRARLHSLLEELIDDALDANVARALYRRRAQLLVESGDHSGAADVFQQLLTLDGQDKDARDALMASLEAAERFQDLTMAIEGEIRRSHDAAHKLAMRRRLAAVWEGPLANRFEALDVWKQVLREAPKDEEALAAVERLTAASRRPMDDDDLLDAPIVDDFGDPLDARRDTDAGDGTATVNEADDDSGAHAVPELLDEVDELTNPSIALPDADAGASDAPEAGAEGGAADDVAGDSPAAAELASEPATAPEAGASDDAEASDDADELAAKAPVAQPPPVRPPPVAPPPVAPPPVVAPPPIAPPPVAPPPLTGSRAAVPPALPPRRSSAPPPPPSTRPSAPPPPLPGRRSSAPPPPLPGRRSSAPPPPAPRMVSVAPPPLPSVATPPRVSALPPLPGGLPVRPGAGRPPALPPTPAAPPLPPSRSVPPPPLPVSSANAPRDFEVDEVTSVTHDSEPAPAALEEAENMLDPFDRPREAPPTTASSSAGTHDRLAWPRCPRRTSSPRTSSR